MTPINHILFVDDERNFLDGIRRMLREYRNIWRVDCAESADEALAMLDASGYDVVVSDVTMPGKSGFDLLGAIKRNPRTAPVPVVILTGNAEFGIKRQALNLGATDLLNKPVQLEDLVARIQSVLRLKQYQDELQNQNRVLEQRVRERTAELAYLHRDIVLRLAKAGELRDEATGDHVVRVANFSRILAERIGLPSDEVERIFLTSPLHDLGKIGIPDHILLKPGRLDAEEWRIMKRHCEIGAEVLLERPKGMGAFDSICGVQEAERFAKSVDPLRQTASVIAMTHHERWDGSGYPNGLQGADIPIAGRIVAYADVYDALRSNRPYKKAFTPEDSMEIITKSVGTQFDPNLFEAFRGAHAELESIRTTYSA